MNRRSRSVSISFAGFRFPPEVILLAVRWYLRYGLSYRDVEELLAERGVEVDHVGAGALTDRARLVACPGASPSPLRVSVVRRFPVPSGGDLAGRALVSPLACPTATSKSSWLSEAWTSIM